MILLKGYDGTLIVAKRSYFVAKQANPGHRHTGVGTQLFAGLGGSLGAHIPHPHALHALPVPLGKPEAGDRQNREWKRLLGAVPVSEAGEGVEGSRGAPGAAVVPHVRLTPGLRGCCKGLASRWGAPSEDCWRRIPCGAPITRLYP